MAYACGPASVVFESVARFGRRLFESLGLLLNGSKLSCWSAQYAIPTCPFRARHLPQAELGCYTAAELSEIYGQPFHAPVYGVPVGGIPLGEPFFIDASLRETSFRIVSYLSTTQTLLHAHRHHSWTSTYYCVAPDLDYRYWLRHLPPTVTAHAAGVVDSTLTAHVESHLYPNALNHGIVCARFHLPARLHGMGLRSRRELALTAFVSGLAEAPAGGASNGRKRAQVSTA